MDSPDLLADLRALDVITPKDDARRRTIIARAYHAAFLAASDSGVADDVARVVRRGALHKQLVDVLTAIGDPALIRVARRLSSLHAWRLIADYVLEMPIPPGQETACIDEAAEIITVVEGRQRRRAFFDILDSTLVDLKLCAGDIDDAEVRLPLLRHLVRIHLARGDAEEARDAAERMGDFEDEGRAAQAPLMAEISAFQRSIGENISARRFLADAVRLAHGVSGDETDLPGAVFRDMVDRLIDGDATDYALEVAEEIVNDSRRDRVLALIAGTEAASGRFDAARNAIDGIADPKRRQAATGPLIVARARDGDIETALAEASALANDDGRVSTLAALAEVLVKAGRTTEALDLVRRVHDEQADMDDRTARLEAVNKALAAQIKAGDGEGAEKAAAALTVDSVTGWVFRLMTDAYAEAGDYDAAFATAARVGSEFFRGRAYQTVAWAAADAGQFGSAEQAVAAIDSARTRVRTRVRLAECQAAAGLSETAKGTLDRALSEIEDYESIADRFSQSEPVARAIIAVRDGGAVEAAVSTALAVADGRRGSAARAVHLLDAAWLMAAPETAAT